MWRTRGVRPLLDALPFRHSKTVPLRGPVGHLLRLLTLRVCAADACDFALVDGEHRDKERDEDRRDAGLYRALNCISGRPEQR